MLTLSAFHTTMPLRPSAFPSEPDGAEALQRRGRAARGGRARLGAVHDHGAPVHPPQVDVRRRDEDAPEVSVVGVARRVRLVVGLVVVARSHQDPVAGPGRVDGRLDGAVRPGVPVEGADQQHTARGRARGPAPVAVVVAELAFGPVLHAAKVVASSPIPTSETQSRRRHQDRLHHVPHLRRCRPAGLIPPEPRRGRRCELTNRASVVTGRSGDWRGTPRRRSLGRFGQVRDRHGETHAMDAAPLRGAKIVVTGVTGQVAEPLACALARDNEVYGAARFNDAEARRRLEAAGVRCVVVDLLAGEPSALPADADYVLNFAVSQDQRLGRRPPGQQRRPGVVDGAPSRRPRLPALLDDGGLQAHGPPRVRRDRPAGRQPRGVAVSADLQHLQDRGRGDGPVGGAALRAPDDDHAAVGSLRRPRGLAGRAPPHDDQRIGDPGPHRRPERLPPARTSTTSPACCRPSSRLRRCRPRWSTGVGARR